MSTKKNPRPLAGDTGAHVVSFNGATTTTVAATARTLQARHALRLACGAEHLHRCGPCAVAEFAQAHGIKAATLDRLDCRRSLAPRRVAAALDHDAGGRQFPPALSTVAP